MNVRLLSAVLVVTVLIAASSKAGVFDDCEAAIADGDMESIELPRAAEIEVEECAAPKGS